jgi:hypothetical protein
MGVSRVETRRRWQEVLDRFELSGLTVAQFCEAEQISVASFYQWRRRLRDALTSAAQGALSAAPRLLPVVMTRSRASRTVHGDTWPAATLDLELPNQIRLRLPRDIEAEFVGQLLSTCAALATHSTPASNRSEARS